MVVAARVCCNELCNSSPRRLYFARWRRSDHPTATSAHSAPWEPDPRAQLRARGLRWTPQRRLILEVLAATDGPRHGQRARRALPRARPRHHPVDRLPDARRPRGARLRPPQPLGGRPRGVPRPAGGRPWPPPVPDLSPDLGAERGRDRGDRRADRAPVRVHRGRGAPHDHRPVCRVRGRGGGVAPPV